MKYNTEALRKLVSQAQELKQKTKREEVKAEASKIVALRHMGVDWEILKEDINTRFQLTDGEKFTASSLTRFLANAKARGQVKAEEVRALVRELGGDTKPKRQKVAGAVKRVSKGAGTATVSKPVVVAPQPAAPVVPKSVAPYRADFSAGNGSKQ